MLAFTLSKAVEDLTARLGEYDSDRWMLKNLKKVRYDHPFGTTPLKDWFEYERGVVGGKRTPYMQMGLYHDEREAYSVFFGSVFRSLFDLSEPTSAYFSTDTELNQSVLYGRKKIEKGLVDIWEHGRYFRLATKEMAEEIRFKLKETEESTFLHPAIVKERPEKPKSGCPFA